MTQIRLDVINAQHPEYKLLADTWSRISLLYEGGTALKTCAEQFLVRRPKEISDVYQARLNRFMYTNHLGTALDWYSGELFEEDPHIEAVQVDAAGKRQTAKLPTDRRRFYDRFLLDCDRSGTSFIEMTRKAFQYLLLYRKAYVLTDLPAAEQQYTNLAEQKAAGALDPYICIYSPREAINWQNDRYGNLDWIVFSTSARVATKPTEPPEIIDYWYIYTRDGYQVWQRKHSPDEKVPPSDAFAELVREGKHVMSHLNRVPVRVLDVSEGLWLANRAYLAAVSHLNTDNVLDWALFMSALAMPVIMTDSDVMITMQEAGFLKLPQDAKYEWTEPAGVSFTHLADRIQELTENIFRAFYLIHQGRSGRATPASQSGVSKQIDMMPSKDILKMFGDIVRGFMQNLLNDVSIANGDKDIEWDVRGFEFKEDVSLETMQSIAETLTLNIPSERLEREMYKRVARMQLPDANPGTIAEIFKEIDDAPAKQDRELGAMVDRAKAINKVSTKARDLKTPTLPKAPDLETDQ
jgi:hypothetical protein